MRNRSLSIFGAAVLLAILLILTNPSKQDYLEFSEKQTGEPPPAIVKAERTNFLFFSFYCQMSTMNRVSHIWGSSAVFIRYLMVNLMIHGG